MLIIPSLCFANVNDVTMHSCGYLKGNNWVEVKAYNNNEKDIIAFTIKLKDKNNKYFTFEKTSKKTLIKSKNASEIIFHNVFFTPKDCEIVGAVFKKKGWFNLW